MSTHKNSTSAERARPTVAAASRPNFIWAHVAGVVFFVFLLAASAQTALAQSCGDDITRAAGICVQQTGLDNALQCRQKAVRDCNCDSSINKCRGVETCGPELQAKAKINVDWIFADRGATGTFESHRRMGESAFEAAVSAQGHNPPVQQLLRQCRAWVEAYLGQSDGCTLANRTPGPDTCRCISVRPTGQSDPTGAPTYRVTNSCPDGLRVSVQFVDAVSTGGTPSTGQAQLICPTKASLIRAPQTFQIPSISAVTLQGATGAYTCVCRNALCN
jgi:hypothetical protein